MNAIRVMGRGVVVAVALVALPALSTPSFASGPPPSSPPAAPSSPSLVSGNRALAASWTEASTGKITYTATATASGKASRKCVSKTLSCSIRSLTNGVVYSVTVVASTGKASSTPSGPSSAIVGVPGPPTSVQATAGSALAVVRWSQPKASGVAQIMSYSATASPGGFSCSTTRTVLAAPTRNCQIPGLTPGVLYSVTVTATNAEGTGAPSKAAFVRPTT